MKRFLTTVFATLFVFCLLPLSACAADNTYYLDEPGMSIDLPSDYVVFTRETKANDRNLRTYGVTKEELYALMLEQNIYLNALDESANCEIIITMKDSPIIDYNLLSDTTLSAILSSLEAEYARAGVTLIRSDIYQHSQAKFAKIYISQPSDDGTTYGLQYNTVYDGKAINITMHSYSGKIDSSKETILKKIVDTIFFNTAPQFNPTPTQTKAFTYTDSISGMTFTVPANWTQKPMSEKRDVLGAKFISNLEEGLAIIFTSVDALSDEALEGSSVSMLERLLISRRDLNNSMLTKADIADMYGGSENDVSMVTYAGKEYFMIETVQSGSAYGMSIKVPMTILVHCENGFMYMFQFGGSKDNPYFGDFLSLVNSAQYPIVQDTHKQVTGLVVIAIMVVAIAILLMRRRKHRMYASKNTQSNILQQRSNEVYISAGQVSGESAHVCNSAVYCRKCGCKLEAGSRFCHKCGTAISAKET